MRHKPLAGHNISLTSHSSLGEQIGCRESNKREIDTVHGHRVFAGHGERGIKSTTKPSPHLCPDPSNIDYRQPVPRLVLLRLFARRLSSDCNCDTIERAASASAVPFMRWPLKRIRSSSRLFLVLYKWRTHQTWSILEERKPLFFGGKITTRKYSFFFQVTLR